MRMIGFVLAASLFILPACKKEEASPVDKAATDAKAAGEKAATDAKAAGGAATDAAKKAAEGATAPK